jgi:hypothetical protein
MNFFFASDLFKVMLICALYIKYNIVFFFFERRKRGYIYIYKMDRSTNSTVPTDRDKVQEVFDPKAKSLTRQKNS